MARVFSKQKHPSVFKSFCKKQAALLIIGATVFDLYSLQDWIPPLTRKTGDLDLSIGLSSDLNAYTEIIDEIKKLGFTPDSLHPYRYHSPQKIPNAMCYIAHFSSEGVWKKISSHPDAKETHQVFTKLAMGEDIQWDIKEVALELKNRGFTSEEIQNTIPQRLKDLVSIGMGVTK